MAGIQFKVDTKAFKKDMGQVAQRMGQGSPKAAHALAMQMARDTEPYVPARTKSLANRTRVDGGTIIYPGPYAHYLYVGKLHVYPPGSVKAPFGANKVLTDIDLNISTAVHSKAQSHWFEASKAQNLPRWKLFAEKEVKRYF